jgi:tight adherence protein B
VAAYLTHLPIAALIAGLLAVGAPYLWLIRKRTRRLLEFEQDLPDGISLLARSLRAGMPLNQSISIAAEEIQGPVAQEFSLIFAELNFGGDARAAWMRFLERMPILPAMALVSSIMIQRESGGNLAELLDRIEHLLRQRFRFQRKIKTLTASNRMAAWTVSVMPFLLAATLELMNPGWVTILFDTPGGRKMVLIAFGMQVAGILWIRQMTRIDL